MKSQSYFKFAMMMLVSFIVMYAVMFLNIVSLSHLYLSTTRFYMAILMVAPMAVSMLLFMWDMYPNTGVKFGILTTAVVIFGLALAGLRTQTPIADREYMKAMIPHHSSAILTSRNADLSDPEVQALAKQIIDAQLKEIEQMKQILERIENEN